jgi:hypothetical protein
VSGYIVDNEDQAAAAVGKLADLSRAGVRQQFEKRFTSTRMAEDYVHVYRKLIGDQPVRPLFQSALDQWTKRTGGSVVPAQAPLAEGQVAAE